MPPILFDFFVCVFTLASFLIPMFDRAQRDPEFKKNGQVCVFVYVCVRSCVCAMLLLLLLLLFIRRFAFGCVVRSVLHFMSVCFRVDWLLLHCSVSVFSSSSFFFFCMMCIRIGWSAKPFLFCFDWSLAT